jgi:hypothetical protein
MKLNRPTLASLQKILATVVLTLSIPMNANAQIFTNWEEEYKANMSLFTRASQMRDYSDRLISLRSAEKRGTRRWDFYNEYALKLKKVYGATIVFSSALRIAYLSKQPSWEVSNLLDEICTNLTIDGASVSTLDEFEKALDQRILRAFASEAAIKGEETLLLAQLDTSYELMEWVTKTCKRASNPKNWVR